MTHCLRLLHCFFSLAVVVSISSAVAASPVMPTTGGSGGVNAARQLDQPYLILVSIDGFRWDYLQRYPTSALQRLMSEGVRAESLRPVYPTLTFPNHYSIATGMDPAEHGIVANDFPDEARASWYHYREPETVQDGSWYRGEPIWVAAERAGIVSAAFYYVGTEAAIGGIAPSHWRAFDASVPGNARVDQALSWLSLPARRRPHLITLYFEHVDYASHRFGPDSPESIASIEAVDGYLQRLLAGIDELDRADDVYVVVVSDHGQSRYLPGVEPLVLADFLDLGEIQVVETGPLAFLYLMDGAQPRAGAIRDAVNARWKNGRAWLPQQAPADWRLDPQHPIADVILQANAGHGVISTRDTAYTMTTGDHGWIPDFGDMHGIFVASGPALPKGESVDTIDAIEIYPLLLEIFGLPDRRPVPHASRLTSLLDPAVRLTRASTDRGGITEPERRAAEIRR